MVNTQNSLRNPSFVLQSAHSVVYEDRDIPQITGDEVLVRITKTGICGSDVHYLHHGRIGDYVVDKPMCLGHESSGVVHSMAEEASRKNPRLFVGARVALEPGYGCRTCDLCKSGHYNLCEQMTFAATPPSTVGTLAKYFKLPADMLYLLPDSVTDEDGAMMEPLAVAVHSVHALGKCQPNQTVIVFGAGPVGLLCMAVAQAVGAARIVAVDVNEDRLAFARGYIGADTWIPPPKLQGEDVESYTARASSDLFHELQIPRRGEGSIDLAIEASGATACQQLGLTCLRPRGTYVQVGMGATMTQPTPLFNLINKEISMIGSFRYGPGDYPFALGLVARGLVDLKPLVTHRYDFTDGLVAFETTKNGRDAKGVSAIKCIINGPE